MLPPISPLDERTGLDAGPRTEQLRRNDEPLVLRARLAAFAVSLLVSFGVAAAQEPPPAPAEPKKQVEVPVGEGISGSPLESGLDTIAEHFIVPIPRAQLDEKALGALLESLDPYSHYLPAAEMDMFRDELDASYAGVGLSFDYTDPTGYPRVAYLLRGGAAVAAGVQRRDLLLSLDGKDLKRVAWDKVASMLRGRAGTQAVLVLRRDGVADPISVTLQRVEIDTPSVRALHRDAADRPDWWLDHDKRIGYLRLASIVADTSTGVENAVRELQRGRARGLVLDLRDCAGGLMQGALETADLFVDKGRLLTIRQRGEDQVFDAKRGKYTRLPLAILINGSTVSSCEILAGALADNGRGTLVGERSFGKGRIQVIYSLGEGRGGMVMSTGTFQRPNGKTIDKHDLPEGSKEAGIAPDVEVKMDKAQHKAWLDFAERSTGLMLLTPEEAKAAPPDPVLEKARALLEN
jgi:carboxyl-terminal processing protease